MIVLMKCLNEEKGVARCINNFHNEKWVDKIVVIDGGSSDYTVQEVKQFKKAVVYIHPWIDWYHDMEITQSNIALSYIPHGMIAFILDFDECCSEELKEVLSEVNSKGFDNDVGNVSRRTVDVIRYMDSPIAVLGSDGMPIISNQIGQYPDFQPRLIKKDYRMRWVNSPHHQLIGWEKMSSTNIKADIIHYEKDDLRDRVRIEKKWLRAQARRIELGISCDIFESKINPELAQYADYENWK